MASGTLIEIGPPVVPRGRLWFHQSTQPAVELSTAERIRNTSSSTRVVRRHSLLERPFTVSTIAMPLGVCDGLDQWRDALEREMRGQSNRRISRSGAGAVRHISG